jgi:hypothetical protein
LRNDGYEYTFYGLLGLIFGLFFLFVAFHFYFGSSSTIDQKLDQLIQIVFFGILGSTFFISGLIIRMFKLIKFQE